MTCEQFDEIDKHHLIKILLIYNLHHLTIEICESLKFKNVKDIIADIYIDWALKLIKGTGKNDA